MKRDKRIHKVGVQPHNSSYDRTLLWVERDLVSQHSIFGGIETMKARRQFSIFIYSPGDIFQTVPDWALKRHNTSLALQTTYWAISHLTTQPPAPNLLNLISETPNTAFQLNLNVFSPTIFSRFCEYDGLWWQFPRALCNRAIVFQTTC